MTTRSFCFGLFFPIVLIANCNCLLALCPLLGLSYWILDGTPHL